MYAAAAAKLLQSCPTLCDPIDGSPPGSPIPGILQARTLEWVAVSVSNAWKWKMKVKSLSCVQLLATNGMQPTRLLCQWDFPGKSTGVGCHCFLCGIRGVVLQCGSSPTLTSPWTHATWGGNMTKGKTPGSSDGKASAYNAGDLGSIPGSGRSPGEGNGNPLQYSCLENPIDWGAW